MRGVGKLLVGLGGLMGFIAVRRFSKRHSFFDAPFSKSSVSSGGRVFGMPFGTKRHYGFTLDRKKLLPPVFMEFVRIPGKEWQMGKYVVTQEQWKEVMGAEPWKGEKFVKEGDKYPAICISWDDCQEFVRELNDSSLSRGWKYRLPTEEEWEYACRAGSTTKYYFGDDASKLGEYAWYDENADDIGEKYAHQVGQKKPNKWGLYDMHGNVWEWTETKEGSFRVSRGGCWFDSAGRCVSSNRHGYSPDFRDFNLGVRLVRERL